MDIGADVALNNAASIDVAEGHEVPALVVAKEAGKYTSGAHRTC